jgi:L-asparaginase
VQVTFSKVIVVGTGGTIAGRSSVAGDNVGYRAGEVGVSELLQALPAASLGLSGCVVESVQLAQVDSKDMGPDVWLPLLANLTHWLADTRVRAVVVTHGTDTLEETAFLLSLVLAPSKPVVLTCAMRPATALVPDGPQNLLDAMSVAMNPASRGVMVVAAGWIHGPLPLTKVHTYRVDAFSSGDVGPMGCIEEGQVRWFRRDAPTVSHQMVSQSAADIEWASLLPTDLPRVELVLSHAGATADLVDALMSQAQGPRPVRGLVVAGTGNGTIHQALLGALQRAQAQGVVVWRCSRCVWGQVVPGPGMAPPISLADSDAGDADTLQPPHLLDGLPFPAVTLSPVKARIALMWTLLQQDIAQSRRN